MKLSYVLLFAAFVPVGCAPVEPAPTKLVLETAESKALEAQLPDGPARMNRVVHLTQVARAGHDALSKIEDPQRRETAQRTWNLEIQRAMPAVAGQTHEAALEAALVAEGVLSAGGVVK